MRLFKIFFTAGVMLWIGASHANNTRVPTFSDYPVKAVYSGKAATVVLDSEDAKMFRTRLREGIKRPTNFAGEHVLVLFGCGTSCLSGAVVSRRTGQVVLFLPGGSVCCWYGEGSPVLYERDSRLLITNGLIDEGEVYASRYYEFTGREFKLIRTVRRDKKADQEAEYEEVCGKSIPGEHDECTTRKVVPVR